MTAWLQESNCNYLHGTPAAELWRLLLLHFIRRTKHLTATINVVVAYMQPCTLVRPAVLTARGRNGLRFLPRQKRQHVLPAQNKLRSTYVVVWVIYSRYVPLREDAVLLVGAWDSQHQHLGQQVEQLGRDQVRNSSSCVPS